MNSRQRIIVIVGLVVSALFLFLAFRDLQPAEAWQALQNANLPLLAFACVWYFSAVAVITLRWRFLMRATAIVPYRNLFQLVCIGYMGNNVYPLRAGELLRIVLLQREHQVPVARSTTIVLAERAFDGIVMLSFILVALLTLNITTSDVRTIMTVTAPLFLAAMAVFFGLALNQKLSQGLLVWFTSKLPSPLNAKVQHLGEELLLGLAGLRTPRDLVGTVLTSYGSWMLEAGTYWIVAQAFNLPIDYITALLVVGVVNLAGLLPASPGGFGVYEGFVRIVLTSVGIAASPATIYGLAIHIVIWLPVTLLGFVFLARKGLSVRAVRQTSAALPTNNEVTL